MLSNKPATCARRDACAARPHSGGRTISAWQPGQWQLLRKFQNSHVSEVIRRLGWLSERLTTAKAVNFARAGAHFLAKADRLGSMPVVVKIDISPLCNLKCVSCVHAEPASCTANKTLQKQEFRPHQKMTLEQYRLIIDQVKAYATVVSLYYLGDPLVHPQHDQMCSIAREAGLNVHTSTNFSFNWSDKKIEQMVRSGLTHLTVCVDGWSQENYRRTRVGGRIDYVLSNLRRLCECRKRLGQAIPRVEVQYLKFQHNLHEVQQARRALEDMGVDYIADFYGVLNNYTDWDPDKVTVHGPNENKPYPQCFWPYFATLIKWNGDVIPCCKYRLGEQYSTEVDPRVYGNVFKTAFREIWNSRSYRESRMLAANPEVIYDRPELQKNFCHGCPWIFRTNSSSLYLSGRHHRWEEVFEFDERGRPVRRQQVTRQPATAKSADKP